MVSSDDSKFMRMALALAEQGRVTAPPNPWVGCVIVNEGEVVGKGFHKRAGEPHAEVNALNEAKEKASGATAYVTLEPCSHYGRTPPCASALIKAKISRVIVGIEDPDIRVSGNGIRILREAGIEVSVEIEAESISKSLAPYIHQRKTQCPYCIGKGAISLDGRIAAVDYSSKWLTSERSRYDAHQIRAESQAILIGSNTAVIDKPRLTVRHVAQQPLNPPLRVILDSRGRLSPPSPLFDLSLAPTLIATTDQCPTDSIKKWIDHGIDVKVLERDISGNGVNLKEVLSLLGSRNLLQVLIEGGGSVLGSFIKQNLLQKLSLYVAPRILGHNGIPFLHLNVKSLNESHQLRLMGCQAIDNDIRADYCFF